MSVQTLKQQTGLGPVSTETKSLTVFETLSKYKSQLAAALPRHMTADRMIRIAMTEIRKNPDLGKCSTESLIGSVVMLSQLGLEPGVMGQAYLIPYFDSRKNIHTCTAVPGWQGMVDLVSRAGRATIHTDAVFADDIFEYEKGTSPTIRHIERGDGTGKFTHVYAVGRVKGAEFPLIEVWSRAKVEAHLKQYNKVGDRHYAKSNENNFQMYGRKCALLQVLKYLPKSVEVQTASELSYAADNGTQMITLDEAVAGTFDASNSYPTIEADSPELSQLFELNGLKEDMRQKFREEYAGKEAELIAYLKEQLDQIAK